MVLMLVPATAFAEETHTATFKFDHGTLQLGDVTVTDSPYALPFTEADGFILGSITDCEPYTFLGWKDVNDNAVYLSGEWVESFTDIAFEAVYQEPPTLAITVEGFQVGNTPEDITLSFASTIPGVTFGKGDVEYAKWLQYDDESDRWEGVGSEAFQADKRYQLVLELNRKGLSALPAVTINGKTPECCEFGWSHIWIECEFGTPAAPTLAITVEGFQAGNTLNDITFSFASTNLGVTFSEDDITSFGCFDAYGDLGEIGFNHVFRADTSYRFSIVLDNKGLELLPAVTVNGETPSCNLATSNGKPVAITIEYVGTPAPSPITINGPDVICAQQDYEFSVTTADGANFNDDFVHDPDDPGFDYGYVGYLTRDEDGVGHGVVSASEYGDADSMVLTVSGTSANGKFAGATKTVGILKGHLFVDGVCGCGAVQQYTVTYDGGEGSDPVTDVKTHGKDLTLRGETFTMDGFVQTGWVDKETGAIYDLGATYDEDRDATLYPYWEKLITVTAPFTTTVALGDAGEPGETTFMLGLIDGLGNELTFDDQYFFAEITTDGAGSYSGTMTITATEEWLYDMLYEGAFIWQYDGEEDGWTYDDTVWGVRLYMPEVAARSVDEASYELLLYPTYVMSDGSFNLDLNAGPVEEMTFTNTYTAHAYELKHDATHHWDECACKDVQNKELHKYGDWKVTKEATQTAKGEKEHTCTVCGYTEKVEIPMRTNVPSGDDSSFALWAALFTLSAAAVITTVNVSKKKKASK